MVRQLIRSHWLLGCAFLLLLGCKKTETAADVPFVPYELLNAGEAPRALLRYAIADGTTTTSTISLKVTPPNPSRPQGPRFQRHRQRQRQQRGGDR